MSDEASTQDRPQFPPEHTSNDLLFSLNPQSHRKALHYESVSQNADEVPGSGTAYNFS